MMRKKKELDIEHLNELIVLGKKILKVLFIITILAATLLAVVLFTELKLGQILLNVLSVASPLFIGFVIAWLLNPAVTKLQEKNVKRGLGSVVVFVIFLLIIFVIIKVMIPMLYRQINEFIEILPSLYLQLSNFVHDTFMKLSETGFDFTSVESKIYETIETFGVSLTTEIPSLVIGGVSSVVSSIWSLLLGLVVGFYLLIDFDGTKKVFNIVPKKYKNNFRKLMHDLDATCKDFVMGTLLISLIVTIITSIFFKIIGLPSPMLFGLICGITNIIPYIGPWIGGAIAAVVGFTVSPLVGILTVVIAFISQQIDGMILQPLIMGKTMKLHPVTIMVGLLVFGYFFGMLGMILATPIMACTKVIFNYYDSKYKIKETIVNHSNEENTIEESK